MSDDTIDMVPTSADFEQRFFQGAEIVSLEIKVLKETYQDMLPVIQRNGWEVEEGLRILLTLGLGYAQGKRLLEADDKERARLADRLINLESATAAMKFRTFSFMKDNQVLEMRMGALRTSVVGLEAVIQRIRPERDAFKEEVDRLRAEVEALTGRLSIRVGSTPEPSSGRAGITDCVKTIIKSFRRITHVNHHQSGTRA